MRDEKRLQETDLEEMRVNAWGSMSLKTPRTPKTPQGFASPAHAASPNRRSAHRSVLAANAQSTH
jgi:hypothetical protein